MEQITAIFEILQGISFGTVWGFITSFDFNGLIEYFTGLFAGLFA